MNHDDEWQEEQWTTLLIVLLVDRFIKMRAHHLSDTYRWSISLSFLCAHTPAPHGAFYDVLFDVLQPLHTIKNSQPPTASRVVHWVQSGQHSLWQCSIADLQPSHNCRKINFSGGRMSVFLLEKNEKKCWFFSIFFFCKSPNQNKEKPTFLLNMLR